jgi:hypothetical protein
MPTWAVASLVGLVLLAAAAAAEPARMRHSGTVVEVGEGTIVLAEIGPWRVTRGRTVVTYRRIEIPRDTPLVLAWRDTATASGEPGQFVESTLVPWGLVRGDFVTVDCVHEGARQIARAIVVVELSGR